MKSFKHQICFLLAFSFLFTSLSYGQPASDIADNDDTSLAVKKAVEEGYLPLFKGNNFQGDKALSRREAAVIIDKLIQKIDAKDLQLTKAELQELLHLSKSFKQYLAEDELTKSQLRASIESLQQEKDRAQRDISDVQDQLKSDLKSLKEDNNTQHWYMIAGGVGLALISILIK